jgi:hypothetical protein
MKTLAFVLPKLYCGEGDEPEGTPPAPPAAPEPTNFDPSKIDELFESDSPDPVNMTQAQLSKVIGKLRVNMRKKNEELNAQIAKVASEANITKEERDRLNNLLEQSRSTFQTELERAQSEHAKALDAYNKLKAESDKAQSEWRQRFEQTLIDQQVTEACEKNDVFSAKQVRDMLDRHLVVTPVLDQKGNPTENFIVAVRTSTDEGETVNLPVTDYVAKMRESNAHPNLFKHSLRDGINANNGNGGGGDGANLKPKDLESLQKLLNDPEKRKAFLAQKIG